VSTFNYRLLIPPEEEEIYPYRRVWPSILLESAILLAVALVSFVLFNILNVRLSGTARQGLNLLLALLPAALWLVFSLWRERLALQPRQRLLAVAVSAALIANAVSIPFIEGVFQTARWLPTASALNRIVGYTFTVGIVQETLKYLVVRYLAWPDQFRTRLDGVAYCAASAIGYATVLNLRSVLAGTALPDIVAMEVFGNVAINLAASIIVGYGLAEIRFDNPSSFLATITVALAALLNGIVIPVRAGLVNAGFSLTGNASNPIFGLGVSAGALLGVGLLISFLFGNAERREQEAAASREV
jgi:RsiW-degrading membrane proteinase PrsW (M82 family)